MKRAFIISRYRAPNGDPAVELVHIAYARAACAHSLASGESPLAPHLFNTQPGILDDTDPVERQRGFDAASHWMRVADVAPVYVDLGVSSGMRQDCGTARMHDLETPERRLASPAAAIWEVMVQMARERTPWRAPRDVFDRACGLLAECVRSGRG